MMKIIHCSPPMAHSVFALASLLTCLSQIGAQYVEADDWSDWRGPQRSNDTSEMAFPLQWSANEHIRWKAKLPDRGNSSPIVVNGKVIITQAVENEKRRTTMAFDRNNGTLLWQQGAFYDKEESTHPQNPYCAASPCSDGERIISTYGSAGVHAYGMNGDLLWHRDLGPQVHTWGNASSPVLYHELCILYHGPGPHAAIYALDKQTGKTVWKYDEPRVDQTGRTDGFRGNENGITGSFSTPLPFVHDGRPELIMSFPNTMVSFEPETGMKIWWASGLNPLVYTSVIVGDGVAVGVGGYKGSSMAVRLGGRGDVIRSHRLWQNTRDGDSVGSGVVYQGHVYLLNTSGIAKCMTLQTGKVLWEERVRGEGRKSSSWSTMIRSGDRLYCLNQSSEMLVLQASPVFKLLSINPLDRAMCNATQAMSEGEIFIRTWNHLWCVSERKDLTLK
ncbi:MAG: PQQ-binding-like beta-propeller repeat protein [Verrucomicrobiota bacterium]|nr:PQQ-binding-like beta-propeller repeat protein [Verrucomicrobiota bacterium]